MIVTARLTFSAAHRLHNPKYDADWNRRTYGKCDNPKGHGHNYAIQVSVMGRIDPETGMVIDLKTLKDIVRRQIIDRVDHTNLNEDVEFLRGVIPTAENLALAFWEPLNWQPTHRDAPRSMLSSSPGVSLWYAANRHSR